MKQRYINSTLHYIVEEQRRSEDVLVHLSLYIIYEETYYCGSCNGSCVIVVKSLVRVLGVEEQ